MIEPVKMFQRGRNRLPQSRIATYVGTVDSNSPSLGRVSVNLSPQSVHDRAERFQETPALLTRNRNDRFEREVMCHLDPAYNLALWLLHDSHDAEDATQSAIYKAFRAFDKIKSPDAKPWLLAIVRNECMNLLHSKGIRGRMETISDESLNSVESKELDPARAVIRASDRQMVSNAIDQLPPEFREVILLREIEEMSYLEIAQVIEKPIGTVMSRLARARGRLQLILAAEVAQ